MPRRVVIVCVALACAALPPTIRAQGLRDQIKQLFTFGSCGEIICLSNLTGVHGDHYKPSADSSGTAFIAFVSSAIGISVANTPISSSSSGTTFRFEGGVPVKTSTSAGPIFAERSQTLGRGRWFVGLGLTQMNFERLRGVPLRHIEFNFTHENTPPLDTLGVPVFENDFIQTKVAMDVNLLVASFSLTYGLADGVDLSITTPFVRTSLQGQSAATIISASPCCAHYFDRLPDSSFALTAVATAAGVATGLGDVESRLKINLGQGGKVGVAVYVAARFPTGDENNLLGSGAFSGRGLGIVSGRFGNFNPHVNIGYTVRDASDQTNSVDVALGYDALLAPWATMAVDALGSWQIGESKLRVPPSVFYLAQRRTLDVTNIPAQRDDYMSLNVGFKFQTRRGIQIVTSALFPLRDSGLQPSVAWTGGLEYNF